MGDQTDAERKLADAERKLADVESKLDAIREGLAELKKIMQPNECPGCGAFRLDGAPPQVHESWCPLHGLAASGQKDVPDA